VNRARVLIVDDERNIVEALRYNLDREGFDTLVAYDGLTALDLARTQKPDFMILDWMLPGLDGLEICRSLSREDATRRIPILLLTVRSHESDKVLALEVGAEDYVTKPFSTREVVARVKARLRRLQEAAPVASQFSLGPLEVDWERHRVTLQGEPIELTTKEFQLLKALVEAQGRVLSRESLLASAWGYAHAESIGTRTVDLHVSQLRRKLGPLSMRLVTVKNAGYRFDVF
jgi:two-component system alkaline phosphatase synthesis response regulator PhoP